MITPSYLFLTVIELIVGLISQTTSMHLIIFLQK